MQSIRKPRPRRRDNIPALEKKLRECPSTFVAYAQLRAATRRLAEVAAQQPVIVGIVVRKAEDIEVYEKATVLMAVGTPSNVSDDRRKASVQIVTNVNQKEAVQVRLFDALTEDRVFLIATRHEDFPDGFEAAADAVIEFSSVPPRLVVAAAGFCHGVRLEESEAEEIARHPLSRVAVAFRKRRPPAKIIEVLNRLELALTSTGLEPGFTLETLPGTGEAGNWGRQLAVDIHDWRSGSIPWSDVDRGVLLSGGPGCGKTTYASALARSCRMSLVLGSLGRWQAKGHLGDCLRAMRGAFAEAADKVPCILFIDEADSFGDRERFSATSSDEQYNREVVNAFLECLDGADSREGVVVVGATSYPDAIDSSIRRPGRLDRHIRIPLPDMVARVAILRHHLGGGDVESIDLSQIASRTSGWSGARLEQLARDARRRARRDRRPVSTEDIVSVAPPVVAIEAETRRRACLHEAGHVIVGLSTGQRVVKVEVAVVFDTADGDPRGGSTVYLDEVHRLRTDRWYRDRLAATLAGLAAEEVISCSATINVRGQRQSG